jgi:hypothetical protein
VGDLEKVAPSSVQEERCTSSFGAVLVANALVPGIKNKEAVGRLNSSPKHARKGKCDDFNCDALTNISSKLIELALKNCAASNALTILAALGKSIFR